MVFQISVKLKVFQFVIAFTGYFYLLYIFIVALRNHLSTFNSNQYATIKKIYNSQLIPFHYSNISDLYFI